MFSDEARDIFMEAAENYGWLTSIKEEMARNLQREIAKKMLSRGVAIEIIAEDTGLPVENLTSLVNELNLLPAGA